LIVVLHHRAQPERGFKVSAQTCGRVVAFGSVTELCQSIAYRNLRINRWF
jgi:hypothetical protein